MVPAQLSVSTPFVQHLLLWLAPFFQATGQDDETLDKDEIFATLAAYGAQTRVEMLHAALALAFSLSALDTLAQAEADADLSANLRLRYRACANALNRSAGRNTAAIAALRRCDEPGRQKQGDTTQPEAERLLSEAQATLSAGLNRLKSSPARAQTVPHHRNTALSHLFDAISPIPARSIHA